MNQLINQSVGHRPWGYYVILTEEKDYKIKQIVVYPGKRLSLQRHKFRAEHWYVLEGEAWVTLDQKQFSLSAKESVNIPCQSMHRLENKGKENLRIIEIQTGEYFGEDDIERFEDDFGRA